ncbi:hypothetical protein LY76DRAFT_658072 [Colletotrichum caudatum]|nr:hypothetical protein LY76DRAFT_658072 [Colletotrichum caudatum]
MYRRRSADLIYGRRRNGLHWPGGGGGGTWDGEMIITLFPNRKKKDTVDAGNLEGDIDRYEAIRSRQMAVRQVHLCNHRGTTQVSMRSPSSFGIGKKCPVLLL